MDRTEAYSELLELQRSSSLFDIAETLAAGLEELLVFSFEERIAGARFGKDENAHFDGRGNFWQLRTCGGAPSCSEECCSTVVAAMAGAGRQARVSVQLEVPS